MSFKVSARAASLAIAAALSLVDIAAQNPTGCRSECDSVPFSAPQRAVLQLSNGCVVRVTWKSRIGCVIGRDVAILAVEPLTDQCGGISIVSLVNEATDALVAAREAGFYDMAGYRDTCIDVGSVLRAACWRLSVECGDTTAVPCDSVSCCQSKVVLCIDEVWRRRVYRTTSTLRAPCTPDPSCVPICPSDSSGRGWPPQDTLIPNHDDIDITLRRQHLRLRPSERDTHVPWPWRDPRALFAPVRATREPTWCDG